MKINLKDNKLFNRLFEKYETTKYIRVALHCQKITFITVLVSFVTGFFLKENSVFLIGCITLLNTISCVSLFWTCSFVIHHILVKESKDGKDEEKESK